MTTKFFIIGACVAAILFIFISGCVKKEESQNTEVGRAYAQEEAKKIVDDTIYIKNARLKTPVCFAYFWRGIYGGPAAYPVPCEAIPSDQLIEVK